MDEFDPIRLDRDIARAARAERRWWRTLREDVDEAAASAWYEPLRYLTTRTTFLAVSDLSAGDPLREPLMRWVHRLALTRIGGQTTIDLARAWQEPSLKLEEPERGTFSPRHALHRALESREPPRVSAWLDTLGRAGPSLLGAERRRRQSEMEIIERLGVTDPSALLSFDRDALDAESERLLARTDDLASSILGEKESLARLLGTLVAREVPGVWPRRPDVRWLVEQFEGTVLLEGLSLDLGPTPASLGAASFARALARFGAAYARAAAPSGGAFVMARDPGDVTAMRRGALFASLLGHPIFLRKRLGFSRDAAAKTSRALALSALAQVRLDATRTLVDLALASPSDVEEAASDALKVHVPAGLAGVLPRPSARAPVGLLGALLALGDADALKSRFDEDWFDNPHALGALREMDSELPSRLPNEALEGAAERLARHLEANAG